MFEVAKEWNKLRNASTINFRRETVKSAICSVRYYQDQKDDYSVMMTKLHLQEAFNLYRATVNVCR